MSFYVMEKLNKIKNGYSLQAQKLQFPTGHHEIQFDIKINRKTHNRYLENSFT